MKKIVKSALSIVMCGALLCGCAQTEPDVTEADFSNVDFETSNYKHINNGGVTDNEVLPYNVDAITGATLTVEGPAVVTSIPLSVRELENCDEGLVRGTYSDSRGERIYEGMDLYHLLNNMVEGDNGIILTEKAYKVVLKNSNRATISEFTLQDVEKAHNDGRPILLAYGTADTEENEIAPFVFDAAKEGEHSLGYVETLDNEDGCIRLVYDADQYGANEYDTFTNVAYVYICEEKEPGFKHSLCDEDGYGSSKYTDYIVTFRGSALGHEINLSAEQLENLVVYDENGGIVEGGMGYSDFYSLANNSYWYVNQYEGLDLYKLLMYLGMDDAKTMGRALSRTTLVTFAAADGAKSNETFSVDTLSFPDAFGFYNKNAGDMGDGSYVPSNADLVDTGYPVLLAYGVNNYPYTIAKTDESYLSGIGNNGGPMRVVFGKTQYNHPNGSNQVQYVSEIIAGENVLYNTHKYTDNEEHQKLAGNELNIHVTGTDGQTLMEQKMTVGDVEDIIYGEAVEGNVRKKARIKDYYEQGEEEAVYEGIDLEYLLMDVLGLPGTNGTITFSNEKDSLTVTLDELFNEGYNTALGREGLRSVIAFAKNGSPLVEKETSAGYVDEIALKPYLDSDPASYTVENAGGPLSVMVPSASKEEYNGKYISNVTSIEIELIPDSYAHIEGEYTDYAKDTVRFYGEGLDEEKTFTVEELESRQTKTHTLDFSFLNNKGKAYEGRYRGLSVYDLFAEIGIKNNAGDVTVYAEDGYSQTFSLSRMKKSYPNVLAADKEETFAMLAYGTGNIEGEIMDGVPLVPEENSEGYLEDAKNDGGSLMLIVPQENADDANTGLCVKNVAAIEVSANEITTWGHKMSDVYSEFLDDTFTFTVKNDESEWTHDFTVEELESMEDIIVRDNYTVLDVGECEGLDIWKFIQKIAGDVEGIEDPIAVTAYASDGYKNDLLSVFYKEGFVNGVSDENGNVRKLILCYAMNGYPLVDSEDHEGYTGLAGNTAGPVRCIAETNQGASVKYCNKLVVTLAGKGEIKIDESAFK